MRFKRQTWPLKFPEFISNASIFQQALTQGWQEVLGATIINVNAANAIALRAAITTRRYSA